MKPMNLKEPTDYQDESMSTTKGMNTPQEDIMPKAVIALPKELRDQVAEGDELMATVIDQNGVLSIRIEKPMHEEYTGESEEDKAMNSDEALEKYMGGNMKNMENRVNVKSEGY